jgi:hypothetical protein
MLAAVAEAAFGVGVFVFREEPEADGNLRAVEELAGESAQVLSSINIRVLHCTPLG